MRMRYRYVRRPSRVYTGTRNLVAVLITYGD